MRTYTYVPGSITVVIGAWTKAIPYREEFTLLAAATSSESGNLNNWLHIWPYKDMNDRSTVSNEASKSPHWHTGAGVRIKQENQNSGAFRLLADALGTRHPRSDETSALAAK